MKLIKFLRIVCFALIVGVIASVFYYFHRTTRTVRADSYATYYVDTATGANTNTGLDWGNAFKEMAKAEAAAQDGDVIRVKSGTYVEPSAPDGLTGCISFTKALRWISDDGSGNSGSVVVRRKSGTVVANYNGASATEWNGFVFDGEGTADYVMLGSTAPQSNKKWTNVIFRDAQNASHGQLLRFASTAGTNNECVNCTFTGSGLKGIQSDNSPIVLSNPTFSMTYNSAIAISVSTATPVDITITNGSAVLSGAMTLLSLSQSQNSFSVSGFTLVSSSTASPIIGALNTPVTITHCNLTTATYLLNASSTTSSLTLSDNTLNLTGSSGSATSGFIVKGITGSAATVEINNNTVNINSPIGATYAAFYVSNSDSTVNIKSNNFTYNSGSEASADLVLLKDVLTPTIRDNTVTNLYATSSNTFRIFTAGRNFTGTAYIGHNTITTISATGYIIDLGSETAGSGNIYCDRYNSSVIEYNKLYGPVYNGLSTGGDEHAIFVGHQRFVTVKNNLVYGSGYGLVVKGSPADWQHTGGIYNNVFVNNTYISGPYFKGAKNVDFYNNTIVAQFANRPSAALVKAGDNGSGQDSSGLHFFNNIIQGSAADFMFSIDPNAIPNLSLNNNIYYNFENRSDAQNYYYNSATLDSFQSWVANTGDTSNFADPKLVSIPSDLSLSSDSPAIDNSYSTNLTSDYEDKLYYGAADIGSFEYIPTRTLTANVLGIGVLNRIYGNGKVNQIGGIASSNANLQITTTNGFGHYAGSVVPEWLDIFTLAWEKSGTYRKTWEESSSFSGLTNTIHVVGDLQANKDYVVKVNDVIGQNISGANCVSGVCLADSTGQITFTYTGTYSKHTFDISENIVNSGMTVLPETGCSE